MKNVRTQVVIATLLVIAAAVSRVIIYPESFSPIIAMALFAGAVVINKKYAFALPLFSMLLSDVLFEISGKAPGFWGWGQLVNYAMLGVIAVLGMKMKKRSPLQIGVFSITSSILFFIVSNLAVFVMGDGVYYPFTWEGLNQCFVAALPFFRSGVLVDLGFSFILFGTNFLLGQVLSLQKKVA